MTGAVAALAAAAVVFGHPLDKPPTGGDQPATCDTSGGSTDLGPCTRVATRWPAPRSGTIDRIRLRAGAPGTLRLVLVRLRSFDRAGGTGEARLVSAGALLRAQGRGGIEAFRVRLRVRKGDHLALQGSSFPALRCDGGDAEQLLFLPPLGADGAWTASDAFDDCALLLQARIRR